jgi:hypothetical protein
MIDMCFCSIPLLHREIRNLNKLNRLDEIILRSLIFHFFFNASRCIVSNSLKMIKPNWENAVPVWIAEFSNGFSQNVFARSTDMNSIIDISLSSNLIGTRTLANDRPDYIPICKCYFPL